MNLQVQTARRARASCQEISYAALQTRLRADEGAGGTGMDDGWLLFTG